MSTGTSSVDNVSIVSTVSIYCKHSKNCKSTGTIFRNKAFPGVEGLLSFTSKLH